jgi:hypothetical protein
MGFIVKNLSKQSVSKKNGLGENIKLYYGVPKIFVGFWVWVAFLKQPNALPGGAPKKNKNMYF